MDGEAGVGCFIIVAIVAIIAIIIQLIIWTVKLVLIILSSGIGILVISIIPVIIIWIFYKTFQAFDNNKFDKTRAVILPSLTVFTGATISFLSLGLTNIWVIIAVTGSSLPLVTLLLYPPLNRRRLIKKYQEGEKHLISP